MGFSLPDFPSRAHTAQPMSPSHPYLKMHDIEKGQTQTQRSAGAGQLPPGQPPQKSLHRRLAEGAFIAYVILCLSTVWIFLFYDFPIHHRVSSLEKSLSSANAKLDKLVLLAKVRVKIEEEERETKPKFRSIPIPTQGQAPMIKARRLARRLDPAEIPSAEDIPKAADVPETLYDGDGRQQNRGGFQPMAPPWFYEHDAEGWGWPRGPWDSLKKPISGSKTWSEYPTGPDVVA